MRLILQPKSTKKVATPYKELTTRLFRFRFFILFRVYVILSLFALFVSRDLAIAVFTAFSLTALCQKLSIHVTPIHERNFARELFFRLVSPRTAWAGVFYGASAYFWFRLVACPPGELYSLQMVGGIPSNARGLDKAASDGLITHSILYLNEHVVYNLFCAVTVALFYTLEESAHDRTRLLFRTPDISPRDALFANSKAMVVETFYICLKMAAFPILYGIIRPVYMVIFSWRAIGGQSVAGSFYPSFWHQLILYPLRWCVLVGLWQFSRKAFAAYCSRGPVHHGKTISEGSSDPNSTLLDGLQSPRGTLEHLEAWLELEVIGSRMKGRREQLYADMKEKPVWKLIHQSFDEYIGTVVDALEKFTPRCDVVVFEGMPVMVTPEYAREIKVKNQSVLAEKPNSFDEIMDKLQEEAGAASRTWDLLKTRVNERAQGFKHGASKTKFASLFEVTNQRRVGEVILDEGALRSAIAAIAHLIVNSYDEDVMGYVQNDIGAVLERFDRLLSAIGNITRQLGVSLDALEESVGNAFDIVCKRFEAHFNHLEIPTGARVRVGTRAQSVEVRAVMAEMGYL